MNEFASSVKRQAAGHPASSEATPLQGARSPFAPPLVPRLSILHLMLWTLCSSIYMAMNRLMMSLQGDLPSGYATLQTTSSLLYALIMGAALTGAIVLATVRLRSGPPMLRAPGHWLLFISATLFLISYPCFILLQWFDKAAAVGMTFFVVYGVIYLFPLIAYSFGVRRIAPWRWKGVFAALAIVALTQCVYFLGLAVTGGQSGNWIPSLTMVFTWGSLIVAAAVTAVSLFDLKAGPRRDWLHWMGVITHVAASSVSMLWIIGSWLIN